MVENIFANFSAYPKDQQTQQTIMHIQQFWTPAMCQQLKQEENDSNIIDVSLMQTILKQI